VDKEPILIRSQIYEPDHVVVLDPTLLEAIDITQGLKKGGWILINTSRAPAEFDLGDAYRIATVDASAIAVKNRLGSPTHPIVNTAILGALARVMGFVKLDSVLESIRQEVPQNPEGNVKAAKEAYEQVQFG